MLSHRAIALQGMGFSPALVAVQGFGIVGDGGYVIRDRNPLQWIPINHNRVTEFVDRRELRRRKDEEFLLLFPR